MPISRSEESTVSYYFSEDVYVASQNRAILFMASTSCGFQHIQAELATQNRCCVSDLLKIPYILKEELDIISVGNIYRIDIVIIKDGKLYV